MAEIRQYGQWSVLSGARKMPKDRMANYIERYIWQKTPVLSPNTVNGYDTIKDLLRKHYHWFYDTVIWDVGRNELQMLVNEMVKDGRSAKYIRNVYGLLTAVLRENEVPVPKVTLPVVGKPDLYEPTLEDIKAIIRAVRGTDLEIPVLFAVHGLRQGEICALRYPKDFNGQTVHVAGSIALNADNVPVRKAPKTLESDRYVRITAELADLVARQGFVTRMSPKILSQAFARFVKRNSLPPMRFHDLRHFFASYLHDQGFSDAQIMRMGGWRTDNMMKRVYRYALEDDATKAKLDASMSALST